MERQERKAIGPVGLENRLVLHSLCQLASWAFVAVLITVLPGVGGENSPRGTISSGTFHQEENNCLPPRLGRESHRAALGQSSAARLRYGARAARPATPGEALTFDFGCSSEPETHRAQDRCPGARAGRGRRRADLLASPESTPGAGESTRLSVSLVFSSVPGSSRSGGGMRQTTCFLFVPAG